MVIGYFWESAPQYEEMEVIVLEDRINPVYALKEIVNNKNTCYIFDLLLLCSYEKDGDIEVKCVQRHKELYGVELDELRSKPQATKYSESEPSIIVSPNVIINKYKNTKCVFKCILHAFLTKFVRNYEIHAYIIFLCEP